MGKLKKALAGMMAVCMLMSTLTRRPPSFAFFRSNLPFSALKSSKLFTISHF